MKKKLPLIVLATGLYIMALTTLTSRYSADVDYRTAQDLLKASKITESFTKINSAITKNPMEPDYYRHRAKLYIVYNKKEEALKELEASLTLNPANLATVRDNIPLYYFLASKDLTQQASPENIDPQYITIVQNYFRTVKNLYPYDAGVYVAIAKYEKRLNLQDDYAKSLERLSILRPDLLEWHPDLIY